MILFDLKCGEGHVFEAWFRNGATYEVQSAAGEIVCPVCGSTGVDKAPMAPCLARGEAHGGGDAAHLADGAQGPGDRIRERLREMRHQVEDHCDYVGDRFPEEARKIHYGEAEERGIYGEATDSEIRALADEGVEVLRIPWLRRHHS